jgi:predicted GNAT family acetyltransferase
MVKSYIIEPKHVCVEPVDRSTLGKTTSFLKRHENYSLFLLGNLEQQGPKMTSAPNSGNFKLIRYHGSIIAVFCLTRRGNLIVQSIMSENWLLESILRACQQEDIPLFGLCGEWSFCFALWNFLKAKGVIQEETLVSKEILYTLTLAQKDLTGDSNVRLLTTADYPDWKRLIYDYLDELNLPNFFTEDQRYQAFLEKVKAKVLWGYSLDHHIVSMAELNAKARGLGQLGGVYTVPEHRRKGFSTSVLRQLMKDCVETHHIEKMTIFTRDTNDSAQRLYESFGAKRVGYYGLMFSQQEVP